MKPKTENKNKPLKKLKTLKKQNEEEQLLLNFGSRWRPHGLLRDAGRVE